jgi:pyruvate kinase
MAMTRRTRILVTVGPASDNPAMLTALLAAGADAFRLNFSHGTRETHAATYTRIRAAASAAGRDVAILQDLSGPKIRVGALAAPLTLEDGAMLRIRSGPHLGGPGEVGCTFDALFLSVRPGDLLLLDDGRIELEVTRADPSGLETRVISGGVLESHKGINVPGTALRTSAVTPKDLDDLRAGVAMGVDAVAVSFVQSPDDVLAARAAAAAAGAPDLPIIAKIEKPQAVDRLDEIVRVADGLMVARGDLGIEMPLEKLPAVQRRIVLGARRRGVPVILATQVLESMRIEPRPTRAEVTDAAHAVGERVDTIMLAGETAVGRHPARAVAVLDTIVREAETTPATIEVAVTDGVGSPEHGRALCEAAVTLAARAGASAIVALTEAGNTARMLAALRPAARILAATPSRQTASRLALVWGVTPVVIPDTTLASVRETIVARGLVPAGAVIVLVSMQPALGREGRNFVQVERAGVRE